MEIRVVHNKELWDTWTVEHSSRSPFLQSWEWGEILKREGKEVERLGVYEGADLIATLQVAYVHTILGWRYAFVPWGPVFVQTPVGTTTGKPEAYRALTNYFKQKQCIFYRIEPEVISKNVTSLKKVKDVEARQTLILSLAKSPEDIFKDFLKETRYSVRMAEKKEVVVTEHKDAQLLIALLGETAKRQSFRLHPSKHYHEIIASPLSFQLIAEHEGKAVATGVFLVYGTTCTYLFGAQEYEKRSLSAQYLVLFEAIKKAKSMGCSYFDFYGVAPATLPPWKIEPMNMYAPGVMVDYAYDGTHSEAGFTQFKLGFGGQVEYTIGTWDVVVRETFYFVYIFLRWVHRLR